MENSTNLENFVGMTLEYKIPNITFKTGFAKCIGVDVETSQLKAVIEGKETLLSLKNHVVSYSNMPKREAQRKDYLVFKMPILASFANDSEVFSLELKKALIEANLALAQKENYTDEMYFLSEFLKGIIEVPTEHLTLYK